MAKKWKDIKHKPKQLEGAELDRAVAEALGWTIHTRQEPKYWKSDPLVPVDYWIHSGPLKGSGTTFFTENGRISSPFKVSEFHPSTNGQQAMDLVEKFDMRCEIYNVCSDTHRWEAVAYADGQSSFGYGPNPKIAICRAVVAMGGEGG